MLTSTVVPITNNQKSANLSQFEEIQNNKEQFFQWFVGFCDAEGHFIISIDNRGYVVFRFIIRLHVNDEEVLKQICKVLQIGVVRTKGNSSVFVVSCLTSIRKVLFPIFEKYHLLTTKALDYLDFKRGIEMKLNSTSSKLNTRDLTKITEIKNNMNLGRKDININDLSNYTQDYKVNPYWLLGFAFPFLYIK